MDVAWMEGGSVCGSSASCDLSGTRLKEVPHLGVLTWLPGLL